MKYSQYDVDKVRSESDIRMIIPVRLNPAPHRILPARSVEPKKFRISRKKGYNNAHCFKCGEGFSARWKHMPIITAST